MKDLVIFSHYRWLDEHLLPFFEKVGVKDQNSSIIAAHGDKFYQYRARAAAENIPFCHVAAIGLLTYTAEFGKECRETTSGWVAPVDWILANYNRFKMHLPDVDKTDTRYALLIKGDR